MFNIKVNYDEVGTITRRGDPDDHSSHNINGIMEVGEDEHYDIMVPYEVEKNKGYFLLYCVYSTGDSFGHDADGCIEFVGLFKTEEEAVENLKRIEAHYKDRSKSIDDYNVKLINEDGKEYDLYTPWCGYFESLSYGEVLEVSLGRRKNRIEFN
jgi:hypothetical protein